MAKFIVRLEKADIVTRPVGQNIVIDAQGVEIIFTREAAEEFARDVPETIRKWLDPPAEVQPTRG